MLATVLVSTVGLIALQVVLIVKMADWMSQDTDPVEGRNTVVSASANGRFAGFASEPV